MLSVLWATIASRSSSRARSEVIGAQMNPEVWCRKNAIFSGVANSAAMIRSPSFSRSSSSTTTTISPLPMAATASSIGAKPMSGPTLPFEETLDVLRREVHLEVDEVTHALVSEGGDLRGVRDQCDGEAVPEEVHDGEAHAVHRDRALLDDVAEKVGLVHLHLQVGRGHDDLAGAVDVALHEVAPEPVGEADRSFEVDRVADGERAEGRAAIGLVAHVRLPPCGLRATRVR